MRFERRQFFWFAQDHNDDFDMISNISIFRSNLMIEVIGTDFDWIRDSQEIYIYIYILIDLTYGATNFSSLFKRM